MTEVHEKPLVSIGLPVYNNGKTLERALSSLLSQDYGNIEIIASDDKSMDDSAAILALYSSTHPHLKVHNNDENLGSHRNFFKVLSLCKGEYFFYASGDDYWHPAFVSTLLTPLIGNRKGVVAMCATKRIWEDESRIETTTFAGNNGMEGYSSFELAKSLIVSRDKNGRFVKNNLFIHGIFEKRRFCRALNAYPGLFKERLLLCQLALAGEFIFVDQVLFEKSMSALFRERNPDDPYSLMLKERFQLAKDAWRLARSVVFSEIVPFRKKFWIIPLLVIFIFKQKNIGLFKRAKRLKQSIKGMLPAALMEFFRKSSI